MPELLFESTNKGLANNLLTIK